MNPTGTNYSWSNTAQWSQVPNSSNQQYTQNQNNISQNPTQPTVNDQPQQGMVNTEPRKDMISRLYRSILGREADQAGLNYYLFNTHIPEAQIAKEMYESTEHNEILSKVKDIREMVKMAETNTKSMGDMEYALQNLQSLNESYKNLIDQKTQTINDLRNRLGMTNENEYFEPNHSNQYQATQFQPQGNQQYDSQNRHSAEEMLLADPFANDHENRIGCVNWLKSWFKFN